MRLLPVPGFYLATIAGKIEKKSPLISLLSQPIQIIKLFLTFLSLNLEA
jgi:hypothetical protein